MTAFVVYRYTNIFRECGLIILILTHRERGRVRGRWKYLVLLTCLVSSDQ